MLITTAAYISPIPEDGNLQFIADNDKFGPVPVAALSKAWVCNRSLAGILIGIPPGA